MYVFKSFLPVILTVIFNCSYMSSVSSLFQPPSYGTAQKHTNQRQPAFVLCVHPRFSKTNADEGTTFWWIPAKLIRLSQSPFWVARTEGIRNERKRRRGLVPQLASVPHPGLLCCTRPRLSRFSNPRWLPGIQRVVTNTPALQANADACYKLLILVLHGSQYWSHCVSAECTLQAAGLES